MSPLSVISRVSLLLLFKMDVGLATGCHYDWTLEFLYCYDANRTQYNTFITDLSKKPNKVAQAEFIFSQFSEIEASLFNYHNYNSTLNLFFEKNHITSVAEGAFTPLTSIEFISLAHNDLETITPGAFRSASKLKILYISYNKLKSLDYGIFTDLVNLEQLILNNNDLKTIDFTVFEGMPSLADLILHSNQISSLQSIEYSQQFTHLRSLNIRNNYDMPCKQLAELKLLQSDRGNFLNVTDSVYDKPNIQGILCKQSN